MAMIKTLPPTSQPAGAAHMPAAEDLAQPHICPYDDCRKTFSKKYNLKAHLRMHTGEKPFSCPRKSCAKKFKWRSSLSSHTIWHERQDAEAQERSRQASAADLKKSSDEPKVDATPGAEPAAATGEGKATEAAAAATPAAAAPDEVGIGGGYSVEQWQGINRKRPRKALAPLDLRGVDEAHVVVGADAFSVESESKRRKTGAPNEREPPHHAQTTPQLTYRRISVQGAIEPIKLPLDILESPEMSEKVQKFDDGQMKSLAYLSMVPGSPVTSDGGGNLSEQSLDLDIFDTFSSSEIEFEEELGQKEDAESFFAANSPILACASPSCANLNPMDRCFKDCELESLQSFYSSNQDLSGSSTFLLAN